MWEICEELQLLGVFKELPLSDAGASEGALASLYAPLPRTRSSQDPSSTIESPVFGRQCRNAVLVLLNTVETDFLPRADRPTE